MTTIKSENKCIFGGYTEAAWNQTDKFKKDEKAFLFSLMNKENKPLKINVSEAIVSTSNHGPLFCDDKDLNTSDLFKKIFCGYSNLGKSYKHPEYLSL